MKGCLPAASFRGKVWGEEKQFIIDQSVMAEESAGCFIVWFVMSVVNLYQRLFVSRDGYGFAEGTMLN